MFFFLLCDFCKQLFESMVRRLVFKRVDVTQKKEALKLIHNSLYSLFDRLQFPLWWFSECFCLSDANNPVMCQLKISTCQVHIWLFHQDQCLWKDCNLQNKSLFDVLKILLMCFCIFSNTNFSYETKIIDNSKCADRDIFSYVVQ